jgi:hypothetical protein
MTIPRANTACCNALLGRKIQWGGSSAGAKSWGADAPWRVVFDALVKNRAERPATLVFGEGAKDDTRGACAPRGCLSEKFDAQWTYQT